MPGAQSPTVRVLTEANAAAIYAPRSVPRTRYMQFTNGGNASGLYAAQTLTSWSGRIPVRLPVATTRWRWAVRNFGMASSAPGVSVNGTGFVFGQQALDSDGIGTGLFVNNQATSLVGAHTIPGDGTWYRSPWFTDPAVQFQPSVNHLVAYGFTGASRSYMSGGGKCWQHTGDSGLNAINPSNTAGAVNTSRAGSPLEWIIEYETVTDRLCWLFLGDSIMEGIAGPYGTSAANAVTSPLADSYPALWAERANALVTNMSLASVQSVDFVNIPSAWARLDLASTGFDGAVIGLGSNDCANSRTLAQYKSSLASNVQSIRTYTGSPNIPIYAVNIMPRSGMTATQNGVRQSINDWLGQMPLGIKGVIDMDGAMTTGSGTQPPIKGSLTVDLIHLSWSGTWRAVSEIRSVLPPMQQAYAQQGNLYQIVTQAQYDALLSSGAAANSPLLYIIEG